MTRRPVWLLLGLLISTQPAYAAQRTVTLTVNNMYCEACPYMVKKTLESVSGVSKVTVSFKDKTAVVVFDDAKASVEDLTTAAAKAGFPSELKS
jgi:mercuric ion binding protein